MSREGLVPGGGSGRGRAEKGLRVEAVGGGAHGGRRRLWTPRGARFGTWSREGSRGEGRGRADKATGEAARHGLGRAALGASERRRGQFGHGDHARERKEKGTRAP